MFPGTRLCVVHMTDTATPPHFLPLVVGHGEADSSICCCQARENKLGFGDQKEGDNLECTSHR